MLPKKFELEKMIAEGQLIEAERKEHERLIAQAAKEKEMKEEEIKLKEKTDNTINHIEENILYAIKKGERTTELRFGDGHTEDHAWQIAVARMKKSNKDYTFKIQPISIHCDNFSKAANVDGVSAREWYEPMWELKVSW